MGTLTKILGEDEEAIKNSYKPPTQAPTPQISVSFFFGTLLNDFPWGKAPLGPEWIVATTLHGVSSKSADKLFNISFLASSVQNLTNSLSLVWLLIIWSAWSFKNSSVRSAYLAASLIKFISSSNFWYLKFLISAW